MGLDNLHIWEGKGIEIFTEISEKIAFHLSRGNKKVIWGNSLKQIYKDLNFHKKCFLYFFLDIFSMQSNKDLNK